jgi:REP element-mobilizing transposase RayT
MPQSLAKIIVHIIFSTKGRVPFLKDETVRREMHAYLAAAFKRLADPAMIVGGAEDHVHLLWTWPRDKEGSKIIGEAKRCSSKWVKDKGGVLDGFQWQNGYGAFSIGQSQIEAAKKYIRNQEEHHKRVSFQEEYLAFLKKYGVEYNEKYIWE